jgi:hypothetical protein
MYTAKNKIEQTMPFHEKKNATPRWQVNLRIPKPHIFFHPYSSGLKTNNPLKPHAQIQTHVGKFLPQSEQDVQILQVSGEEHKKKKEKERGSARKE